MALHTYAVALVFRCVVQRHDCYFFLFGYQGGGELVCCDTCIRAFHMLVGICFSFVAYWLYGSG